MKYLSYFVAFSALFHAGFASARSLTWLEVADSALQGQSRYSGWACQYVIGSARAVTILERDNEADYTLISVRYDYRCGDSTLSDTAYMSFKNVSTDITITCADYAVQNGRCTIDGAHYKAS